jgi:hypothetical protein
MLTTVILPPGMRRIQNDRDEEATVISQPDFGDENIELFAASDDPDEVRTMVTPGLPDADDHTEEEEDPDLMKTMIIRPPLFNDEALNAASDGDETLLFNPGTTERKKPK